MRANQRDKPHNQCEERLMDVGDWQAMHLLEITYGGLGNVVGNTVRRAGQ